MVIITKHEKEYIIERLPKTHIHRTVRQKSKRHKYYMEESTAAMRLLNELRSLGEIKTAPRKDKSN